MIPDGQFTIGIALFNRGEFFECHEALEAAWLESSGDDKTFLQGLIQVAVAFYHLRRSNYAGSGRLLRAGIEKLAASSRYRNRIDLNPCLEHLSSLLPEIEAQRAAPEIRLLPQAG
jgi:predicted metal-dependent hydrolase